MEASRQKRVELILQQLEDLPTLPAVAVRVLEITGNRSTSADEVVEAISSDPALTSRILELVNRAGTGSGGEITSVKQAVVLLGFDAVRNMVLAVSVFHTMEQATSDNKHFKRADFWKHSIAVACCAELLSGDCGVDASEALVCGLLHDLGKVGLAAKLPKSFDRVVEAGELLRGNIADLERSIIGLDHMVVGKRLAEGWKLPQVVRESIWLHGQAPSALPANVKNPKLVNLITLADILVRQQHLGYSGNYTFPIPRQTLLDALGISPEKIDESLRQLVWNIEKRAAAIGLGKTNSSELYLEALSQANHELGRVGEQLAARNKRLSIRAQYFDALSHFQSELRADAAPGMVLQAIGQTAVGVLGVTSVAVFSVLPGQPFAETMLFDKDGEAFQSTVIDCPVPIARPANSDGPLLPAGVELEWLLANVSPRLAVEKRFWISLEADGQCIGGVLWGANSGEALRLSPQTHELTALSLGWGLALRMAQVREESRALSEQLVDANRRLHSAQDEIQRSKTIITVGEMAAGAAHEMNNPLAVISGRSQLLLSQMSDPKLKHAAKLIYEQAHIVSEIITELMDFAQPAPAVVAEADLCEVVQRALHEAKFAVDPVDRNFEVTFADIPPVMIDVRQVTTALVEVVCNAIQATDEKNGTIAIHAAYDPYSDPGSAKVVLTVSDNGGGMDEATLKRAFDPFFSCKSAGRRRGMGLAKALRWIQTSGGVIRLESRLDKGTRSIITLPAANMVTPIGTEAGSEPLNASAPATTAS